MKQNTKFLWMYICILFSFAVILIVFAGLSTNEEKGLENKVEKVSYENNNLKKEKTSLENSIKEKNEAIKVANANYDATKKENDALKKENETLKTENNNYKSKETIENTITQALTEFQNGNNEKCLEYLNQLDVTTLSVSQTYLYNLINEEITSENERTEE